MNFPQRQPEQPEKKQFKALVLGQDTAITRRERLALDGIWASFCEQVVVQLTPVLRCPVSLQLKGFGPRRYLHYLDDRERDAPMLHFSLDQGGRAFFSTPLSLLLDLYDALLGGVGRLDLARAPYLTEIEAHLLRAPMHALLSAYQAAWAHLQFAPQLEPDYVDFNPYKALICPPNDTVLVCVFQLELPFARGPLELVLPWAPLRRDLARPAPVPRGVTVQLLGDAQLQVALRLGSAELLFQDLLGMEVGDTLILDRPIHGPLPVTVNGLPKFEGYPGERQGRLAARITRVLEG